MEKKGLLRHFTPLSLGEGLGVRPLLNEIWQTARRNKLRTTLTGFAVAWGIFMIVVLLGAGNGLINALVQQNSRFLASSMVVFGGQTSKPYRGLAEGRSVRLHDQDIAITGQDFRGVVDEVGAQYQTSAVISRGQQYVSTQVSGVYPNHTKIDKVEMLHGRFINVIDLRERRKVVVLGSKQAQELLGRPSAATELQHSGRETAIGVKNRGQEALIGQYVKVGTLAFKVVGIFKEQENRRADAFAPYSTIKSIYGTHTDDVGRIEFTFHGLATEQANEQFERDYRRRMNSAHQAHPDDESALWLWNRYTQNMQMNKGMSIIRTALWVIGLFTLLSGIVGVSNIMLITVKERTHEFGIRKAIGAKPWAILRLIIVESVIITTIFGYVGMVLGVAANEYMDATLGHDVIDTGLFRTTMFVNPTVGLDVCIEATVVMIVAGTVAGLIPAFKASRIRPIEALNAD